MRRHLARLGTCAAIATVVSVSPANAASPDPTPLPGSEFVLDPLGPTTDDEDEGNSNGTAAAVGIAAAALIAGGIVLRRQGRK